MSEPIEKNCKGCGRLFLGKGDFCGETCREANRGKLQADLGLNPDGGQWGSCPGCGQAVFFYSNGNWSCNNSSCSNYGSWSAI